VASLYLAMHGEDREVLMFEVVICETVIVIRIQIPCIVTNI
jgi:hypothetical protein